MKRTRRTRGLWVAVLAGTAMLIAGRVTGEERIALKHAIGVANFDNQAGWRGRANLGNNLATMLESALHETERFVIVDRQQLEHIIREQDLAASGRAAQARGAAQTGQIRPARYLARGTITEVEESQAGADGGVRIRGVRVGGGRARAQITAIVSLVDTSTGEIVAQERITGHAGRTRVRVGLSRPGFSGDLGGFTRTPLGEAAQDIIDQAAQLIARGMADVPFEGAVVQVSQRGQVIINRGAEFGVQPGQELVMAEEGETLVDPDTGAILGRDEGRVIGRLRVERVQDALAFCEVIDGEAQPPRGTRVTRR